MGEMPAWCDDVICPPVYGAGACAGAGGCGRRGGERSEGGVSGIFSEEILEMRIIIVGLCGIVRQKPAEGHGDRCRELSERRGTCGVQNSKSAGNACK